MKVTMEFNINEKEELERFNNIMNALNSNNNVGVKDVQKEEIKEIASIEIKVDGQEPKYKESDYKAKYQQEPITSVAEMNKFLHAGLPVTNVEVNYTHEQIAKALSNAMETKGMDFVRGILVNFNANSLMDVKESYYTNIANILTTEGVVV